jgi:hypothetical protein
MVGTYQLVASRYLRFGLLVTLAVASGSQRRPHLLRRLETSSAHTPEVRANVRRISRCRQRIADH